MSSRRHGAAGGSLQCNPTPPKPSSESKPAAKRADSLLPSETVQKLLISTTSRVVAEYKTEGMVITHAWPDFYRAASTARMFEGPLSRSGLLVAFETERVEAKAGSTRPDYSPWGEVVCAYLSVLFGKRFDSHGLVEGSGLYRIPEMTAFGSTCNPKLAFNSHEERARMPVPLNLENVSSIERVFTDRAIGESPTEDQRTLQRLDLICRFYMRALQNAERDAETAYVNLVTAGELLAGLANYSSEDRLDRQTRKDLRAVYEGFAEGPEVARRLRGKLMGLKRTFVSFLTSWLDEQFFEESEGEWGRFDREDMESCLGAAYDLRSKYLHSGVPFGAWIDPAHWRLDRQLGVPVVDKKVYGRTLERAPLFSGHEQVIRYCVLRFMGSGGLYAQTWRDSGDEEGE